MIVPMKVPSAEEDENDIEFAGPILFESTNQVRNRMSELTIIEKEELLHFMWRELENIYGHVDSASMKLGKLIRWHD